MTKEICPSCGDQLLRNSREYTEFDNGNRYCPSCCKHHGVNPDPIVEKKSEGKKTDSRSNTC